MTEEIPHGEKMISFKLRFWTDGLKNPKMAWNKGAITVITNRSRGIRSTSQNHVFFDSIEGIPNVLKECLKKTGITLVERENGSKKIYLVE